MGDNTPLVSVGMTAYNHEKYIMRALESVLMQEVDFEYEIVIGEDCSQDRTREIILEYQAKYPHIIKPILYEKNVGMKQNYLTVRDTCKGKYRTTLEGDDFWITCDRLKKQVDFLEKHPEYVAICAGWVTLDEKNHIIKNPFEKTYYYGEEYTLEQVQNWLLPGHTCTMMYRNLFLDYPSQILKEYSDLEVVGDRKLSLFLALHGTIYISKEIVAARRIIQSSQSSFFSTSKRRNMYYDMFRWTHLLEQFAKNNYDVALDYSNVQEQFWLASCFHFFKLPCSMHYKVMRNIYKNSQDKKNYRRLLRRKIGSWIHKTYSGKNVFVVTFNLLKKIIKLPRKMLNFHRNYTIKNKKEKTSVKDFI